MDWDWKEIETAPKDGRIILLWSQGYPVAARWIERVGDWVTVPHNSLISQAFGSVEHWTFIAPPIKDHSSHAAVMDETGALRRQMRREGAQP